MTAKIKKQLVLVLIGVMVAMIGLFAFTNNQFNSKAISCESVLEQELKTKYVIGETFQVPSATISYKGSEFNAEKWKVVYPSGKTMTTNRVVLDEAGEYSLTYISKYNGDLLQSEKKLNVVNSVYSVGSNSTVSFGMDERVDNADGFYGRLQNVQQFAYHYPGYHYSALRQTASGETAAYAGKNIDIVCGGMLFLRFDFPVAA